MTKRDGKFNLLLLLKFILLLLLVFLKRIINMPIFLIIKTLVDVFRIEASASPSVYLQKFVFLIKLLILHSKLILHICQHNPALLHECQGQVGVLHNILLLELDVVFLHEVKSSFEEMFGAESLSQRQHSLGILTVQIVFDAV